MNIRNLLTFVVSIITISFAIIFNSTTAWTLFFILIPVFILSSVLLLKKIVINIEETSISSSQNEPIHLNVETSTPIKTLAINGHISNKNFSSLLDKTSQSDNVNHILTFSNNLNRGIFNDACITLNISDPFSLISRNVLKKQLTSLTIYPRKRPYEASLVIKSLSEHINSKHSFGIENDYSIDTISTYKPNDSIRNIHWKLSSKNEEVYVKHYNKFLRSKTKLVLHPADSENFETALSLFYSLAIQDTYLFNEILIGDQTIHLPKEISKFATLTPHQSDIKYQSNTLIVTPFYLKSNTQCIQLVVNKDNCILFSENGVKLSSFQLNGGNNYE